MGGSISNVMCKDCGNVKYHNNTDNECLSCPQTVCCEDGWFIHLERNSNIDDVLQKNTEIFKPLDDAFKDNREEICYENIISFVEFLRDNQKFVLNQDKHKIIELFDIFQKIINAKRHKIKMTHRKVLKLEVENALKSHKF